MQTDLPAIESSLAEHRVNLDAWLDSVYDQPHASREYSGELDCSYDLWGHIESTRVDERDGEKFTVFFVVAPDGLCYYFHEPLPG